ncbi:class I adenylate-forming enzyme family protein [Nocardioides sp.]|uniref:class I adenylate-forming enzyme family protein n=1 Tax=Nocardioides sp. TaxID=35761 RepID=UPI003D11B32F
MGSPEVTVDGPQGTVLAAFAAHRRTDPEAVAVQYYGRSISRAELDELSDALADWLAESGVSRGDRVAVSLQNTPMFAVALLATWKLGAVFVPVNPMLRTAELTALLADCEPRVLLAHPDMAEVVVVAAKDVAHPPTLLWSSPSDLAGDLAGPWSAEPETLPAEGTTVLVQLDRHRGRPPRTHLPAPEDLALLVYTSGTTGPSKGAMLTHANIGYHAVVTPAWLGLDGADSVLTIAPFFHITGLGMHLALGLGNGMSLVMTCRFEPRQILELVQHYRPRFTVGTITAYIALAEHATSEQVREALSGMSSAISGGAAVPAAVVDRYEHDLGVYIRNGYGLTETASACVIVPPGQRAPVDEVSGATSIGQPLPWVSVSVVADDGSEALAGTVGEIVLRGPQVGTGYWRRPDETVNAFQPDGLHTGDIGMVDGDGWIYLVDRKKDLIVSSGYKVWPRDVEDILYRHPAVAEAAVIGVPDDYRGESVQAFVTVRPGHAVTADELNRHCRELLSAYKCPRHYEVVPDLPKSASGKILRRLLRSGE